MSINHPDWGSWHVLLHVVTTSSSPQMNVHSDGPASADTETETDQDDQGGPLRSSDQMVPTWNPSPNQKQFWLFQYGN